MKGEFLRFVSFEVPPTGTDATYGTPTGDWTPLVYAPGSPAIAAKWRVEWMPVMPSRSESVRQGLEVAREQVRLRMRWRSDITAAMRVRLYGGSESLWQIVGGPTEISGRKRFLEMVLEKHSSTGGNDA